MATGAVTGKGKKQEFTLTDSFTAGEPVIIKALVLDATGNPVSNATVEITIGGPESMVITSAPSDVNGWADATWNTQAPNRKGQGGTAPGLYTALTTNVTASGYDWVGVTTRTTFPIQSRTQPPDGSRCPGLMSGVPCFIIHGACKSWRDWEELLKGLQLPA